MGPDRHLVCWEISLGWSERLPSPLPAPAHQMWGEGHIARSLCSAGAHSLCFLSRRTAHIFPIHSARIFVCRHRHARARGAAPVKRAIHRTKRTNYRAIPYLCSSPPSPLLLRTILHRSEATSSFCWLVRLRLGSCSWQALLSERLNSRYGTKACWSSSQYSRLHGTWRETVHSQQMFVSPPKASEPTETLTLWSLCWTNWQDITNQKRKIGTTYLCSNTKYLKGQPKKILIDVYCSCMKKIHLCKRLQDNTSHLCPLTNAKSSVRVLLNEVQTEKQMSTLANKISLSFLFSMQPTAHNTD